MTKEIKRARQLQLMEDAMIIYRLAGGEIVEILDNAADIEYFTKKIDESGETPSQPD